MERRGFVVAGYREDSLQIVLPLWHGRAADVWYGLGEFRADYTEAVAVSEDDALGAGLWSWLYNSAPCRTVKLSRIPRDSLLGRTAPPPNGLRERAYAAAKRYVRSGRVRYHETHEQLEHPYADRADVEQLAERIASKETRRKINVLRRNGELTYRVLYGREILSRLPEFFDMHRASFALSNRTSQFESAAERQFYEQLVVSDALASVITMDVLAVADRPVALHIGFQHGDRIYWYKPAFDPGFSKGSPGRVLLANLFARAAGEKVQCVDLLKGDEDYKVDWSTHNRRTVTSTIVERSLRDVLGALANRLGNWNRRRSRIKSAASGVAPKREES